MTYARAYTLLDSHHVDHVRVRIHFVGDSFNTLADVHSTRELESLKASDDVDSITLVEEN